MELIAFGVGINWIAKLYKRLRRIQKKRKKELNDINDIMFGDPLELAKYYVEPNCQETNPADRHEEDFLVSSEPIYKKIDEFLRAKRLDQPGNNQMIVLSDAGMGKTSLLAILKLMHLTSFWPKNNDCVLKKLWKETLEEIKNIDNKRETILLLDALDEDPKAYGRVKDRLLEVLKATENFHRVIITCRTQFFPEVEKGPFERPGLISIGGYVCPAKYLSLFNDEKVEIYLKKRFPMKYLFLKSKNKIEKARELISHMGSLRCRPMLLAYIDKLIDSPLCQEEINEYRLYNALVESWLRREEVKTGFPKNELFKACEILAIEISIKGERDISERELDILIADVSGLRYVKSIDIKGRSLLNKNSSGNYRFSHYSIQEFLLTKRLIENPNLYLEKKLKSTNLIVQMLIINGKFKDCHHFFDFDSTIFKNLDIRGVDLHKIERKGEGDFKGADLKGADLKGVKLVGEDLKGANLQNTDLQVANLQKIDLKRAKLNMSNLLGANLQRANLQKADLSWADLSWADFKDASLQNSNFKKAKLYNANLLGANLKDANFHNANLVGARLTVTQLREANFQGANLQGIDLRGADLSGVDLEGVNLQKVDLEGANLHNTNLLGADLKDANFHNANLVGVRLTVSQLREANFQGANLQEIDLRGADLSGIDLEGANLYKAILQKVNLRKAHLPGADLVETDLKQVDLKGANLQGAKIQYADLSGADLKGANFHNANLLRAKLDMANLAKAKLQGAILQEVDLRGLYLRGIDLKGANLQKSNLQETNLQEASLQEANLGEVNLRRCNLQKADLQGALLQRADFKGAILFSTNLKKVDLSGAKNITVEMLLNVSSLYQIKGLDYELERYLRKKKPRLFEKHGE